MLITFGSKLLPFGVTSLAGKVRRIELTPRVRPADDDLTSGTLYSGFYGPRPGEWIMEVEFHA